MSRVSMSELAYDIEQLYIEGLNPRHIAKELNCSIELVLSWIADQGCKPFDQWDESAQNRLINDVVAFKPQEEEFNPFNTLNS